MTPKHVDGVVPCELCHQPVEVNGPHTWRLMSGWARPRAQGGTNGLALRAELAAWAHDECIEAGRTGRHVSQQAMF